MQRCSNAVSTYITLQNRLKVVANQQSFNYVQFRANSFLLLVKCAFIGISFKMLSFSRFSLISANLWTKLLSCWCFSISTSNSMISISSPLDEAFELLVKNVRSVFHQANIFWRAVHTPTILQQDLFTKLNIIIWTFETLYIYRSNLMRFHNLHNFKMRKKGMSCQQILVWQRPV